MKRTDAVVIGGGQAGLAMSRCLLRRGIDHVVLERGRVAERWRSERWGSLRLLTPSWQSRLPDFRYGGPDPDGYMAKDEVVAYLEAYRASFDAPVQTGTTVESVAPSSAGYTVTTDRGTYQAGNVVLATGHCDVPRLPGFAAALRGVVHVVPSRYEGAHALARSGVLVVGASATGVQLAEELQASGRQVTLSVGRHTRLPRRYRGRDIMWWLDRMGVLDEPSVTSPEAALAARRQPSMQLVGREGHTLDLGVLRAAGVRIVGRATAAASASVTLADDLAETLAAAHAKLERTRARIDAFIAAQGLAAAVPEPEPLVPIEPPPSPASLDLRAEGIGAVVWATGYTRSYPWLHVPVLDAEGEVAHRGGITEAPGLYVLGLHRMRRRNSSFLDGVGRDAEELAEHLAARLDRAAA